ncbi:UbiX family flavin prenyltransferase [Chlamydiales bacterium]|nr:UbiX family flavin prenyltransferase [Chlamydiales bacterium]
MIPIVLGISGASGITLAVKALKLLTNMGQNVEVVMSKAASQVALQELGPDYQTVNKIIQPFRHLARSWKTYDFTAPIASGSFRTKGMIIIPCSMGTLAGISHGMGDNLMKRAADVTLKERRPLIIVPREAPFNQIHLENMLKLTQMGAIIHPPMPAWYEQPMNLEEMENYMVHRILDPFNLEGNTYQRWGEELSTSAFFCKSTS